MNIEQRLFDDEPYLNQNALGERPVLSEAERQMLSDETIERLIGRSVMSREISAENALQALDAYFSETDPDMK